MELTQIEIRTHLATIGRYLYMHQQPKNYKRADMFKSLDTICEYLLQEKALDTIRKDNKHKMQFTTEDSVGFFCSHPQCKQYNKTILSYK
jgi:hypothetical protein